MGRYSAPGGRARQRVLRRWWPDRNPLRRRADRAEAMIAAFLLVLFAVGGPVSAVVAGQWAYHAGARHLEQTGWHRVSAVLLGDSPYPALAAYGGLALPEVRAQWAAPTGAIRRATIAVSPGARAGTSVTLWINRSGQPVGAPLRPRQVAGQAVLAAILAPGALALVLLCTWLLARYLLDRRRLAGWEAAWRSTGPQWSKLS